MKGKTTRLRPYFLLSAATQMTQNSYQTIFAPGFKKIMFQLTCSGDPLEWLVRFPLLSQDLLARLEFCTLSNLAARYSS